MKLFSIEGVYSLATWVLLFRSLIKLVCITFITRNALSSRCNRCDIIDLLELHEHVLADHGTNKFELTREESNIRNDDYNEVRAVRRGKRLTERDRD